MNASTGLSMNGKSPMISTAPLFVLRLSKDERRVFQQNHIKQLSTTGEIRVMADNDKPKKGGIFQTFKDIVYGMSSHEMTRHAVRSRASMEHLFILITMGDLLGVPILPPYYSLRLLPYVTPQISAWKRRMLRERDITDTLG